MGISYKLLKTIPIPPKSPENFDFGWVDPISQRFYLCDRDNACVDVIDAAHDSYITTIHGFCGVVEPRSAHISGPNGLDGDHNMNQLWVGDGDSSVRVADMNENRIIATVRTSGRAHVDLLGYDPRDKLICACNASDNPPFVSFISTKDFEVVGKLTYATAKKMEEPLWNARTNKFYLSLPETAINPGGEIAVIDPISMNVTDVIPLTNSGVDGIAFDSDYKHLMLPCGTKLIMNGLTKARTDIMDVSTGEIIQTITEVGGSDQSCYNPGDNRYYIAASGMTSDGTNKGTQNPVLGVIDAKTNEWLVNVR